MFRYVGNRPLLILVGALLIVDSKLVAQTGIAGASGTSTQILKAGTLMLLNFSDTSFKASLVDNVVTYGSDGKEKPSPWGWGVNVKGASVNGFSTLESGGSFSGSISGGGAVTWQHAPAAPPINDGAVPTETPLVIFQKIALGVQYTRASLAVSPRETPGSVTSETFNGFEGSVIYNAFLAPGATWENAADPKRKKGSSGSVFLFGAGLTAGRTNNYADLPKGSACTLVAAASGTAPLIEQCKDVRIGSYEAPLHFQVDTSLTWFPGILGNQVAPIIDIGYDTAKSERWTPGVGLAFAQKGDPRPPIGALTLQRKNGAWSLGVQAGVPFGQ